MVEREQNEMPELGGVAQLERLPLRGSYKDLEAIWRTEELLLLVGHSAGVEVETAPEEAIARSFVTCVSFAVSGRLRESSCFNLIVGLVVLHQT